MSSWKASIYLDREHLRVLVTDALGDDLCKIRLPTVCRHPRSLTTLMEALAFWSGAPLHAAIFVAKDATPSSVSAFFGKLWPEENALVHYKWHAAQRCPHRIKGVGDFRYMYRLHGRGL
mgnify:CR=1 FL=1